MAQRPDPLALVRTMCDSALNRLAKWRGLLAGWQLGTRPLGDPESDAVRHHREGTLLLRAEATALVSLLIEHGVFTEEEWLERLRKAALDLESTYQRNFPGVKATDEGLSYDLPAIRAAGWMRGCKR